MTPAAAGDERRRALALSLADGIGPVRWRELAARHGGPAAAFDATAHGDRRERLLDAADDALARADRAGARVLLASDHDYPSRLLDLPDAPPALYALGAPAAARRPAVAIVGTRDATPYGERVAAELAEAAARAGATVVSGLARGIDAAAHRATLAAGGRTVAVLGTGVDVAYPADHRRLHAEIVTHGLVLSEEPCGGRPRAGSFPRRNRIIAALADVTLVVEAGAQSGALITAGVALDLGRAVAAVPGYVTAPRSVGCNRLLRDGAAVVAGSDDLLALLALPAGTAAAPEQPGVDVARAYGDAADAVWSALAAGPLDADNLVAHAGVPAHECLAAITALELAGLVAVGGAGELRRL